MVYSSLKTPGVYVNEVSIFPPSVAQVPTAIPGFIGYTEIAEEVNGESLLMKPKKISSMVEFELYFGLGPQLIFDKTTGNGVELDPNGVVVKAQSDQQYFLYDSMQLFFANGGGDCYIISVGSYTDAIDLGTDTTGMQGGLEVLKEVDEPTMIVFPDAVSLSDMYTLQQFALEQCGELMDRVGVLDIQKAEDKFELADMVQEFRDNIGTDNLKYGAVYAPWLKVGLKKDAKYHDIKGQIVKSGTTVDIDLTTLVNPALSNAAVIQSTIAALDQITTDNATIQSEIDFYLNSANNVAYRPDGFSALVNLPSIGGAFDLLVQSVNNKIAAADAEAGATKPAKVTDAANELRKMIHQILHLIVFVDDFGFKNPAPPPPSTILNDEIAGNTWSLINYTSLLTPDPLVVPNPFDAQVTALLVFDVTVHSIAAPVINSISSTPLLGGAIRNGAPFSLLNFETINIALPGATVAAAGTGLPHDNPANEDDRIDNLKFAVGYLKQFFSYFYTIVSNIQTTGLALEQSKESGLLSAWPVYKNMIDKINSDLTVLPPSGAIAGIYARVDNDRGVWKAPANVTVIYATGTLVNITDNIQDGLNVDVDAGKSVNAIRTFSGKGTLVWGARTLAGNDNEWRYISVRRFFNMVEESVKKSTSWVVFEANDANTWVKVKSMIENYLTLLWREGALAGSKPEDAFFVEVGLNKTMTYDDILNGRMIVKIGMAAVRPAEFIILEFSHKVQTS